MLSIVLIIGVPLLVYEASPVPGALLARKIIGAWSNVEAPADYASFAKDVSVMRDVTVEIKAAPTAKIDVYAPKHRTASRPIILWIHGGAFVGGDKEDAEIYATMLAHEGYVVASLDYTRPPDARYPMPIRQANATLGFLQKNASTYGGDPTKFFIAGNSSGAQLASQTAAVETNPRLASAMRLEPALPQGSLRGAVLNCGAYDMQATAKLRAPFYHVAFWSYTGYRNMLDFPEIDQMSTVRQVTSQYPPVFLSVGNADPLAWQSYEFAKVLRRQHVPVTTQFWEGSGAKLEHDYQFKLTQPQARQTFKNAVEFLDTRSREEVNL